MEGDKRFEVVARKTRQRLLFASIVLVLYFSYTLNYLEAGSWLGERLGDSYVTGSLALFICLIVFFIVLELVFLALNRDPDRREGDPS